MPDYATADLKLVHPVGPAKISLAVNNLMNKHYYSYAIRNAAGTSFNAYPQRERNVTLGLEYRY
jgi:iron complex outermembrane receptor protein